jgi:hypothetical protein
VFFAVADLLNLRGHLLFFDTTAATHERDTEDSELDDNKDSPSECAASALATVSPRLLPADPRNLQIKEVKLDSIHRSAVHHRPPRTGGRFVGSAGSPRSPHGPPEQYKQSRPAPRPNVETHLPHWPVRTSPQVNPRIWRPCLPTICGTRFARPARVHRARARPTRWRPGHPFPPTPRHLS